MSPARPAVVRVYLDADVLGLARLVRRERADFTFPGDAGGRIKKRTRPRCPITDPGTRDSVWIPIVASRGWLILTRDRATQDNRAEIDAVRNTGAKMVNFASADAGSTWGQLEVLMTLARDRTTHRHTRSVHLRRKPNRQTPRDRPEQLIAQAFR